MPEVAPDAWKPELAARAAAGHAYLDVLTVIDRGAELEVIVRLVDMSTVEGLLVSTRVPADRPEILSIVDLFPAADWHEREAAEMFGVRFIGHPDPRPLLTDGTGEPLRKATPLPARVAIPWPGADASARRRSRVPGVPDEWTEGRP
jgi:NADH-quinone oxidoreductase subunit C